MLDSDTLPVDHAGNSAQAQPRSVFRWVAGVLFPPLAGAGLASGAGINWWAGTGAGVLLAIAWVAALAWRDLRRALKSTQIQETIEEAWTAHAKGEANRAEALLKESVQIAIQQMGRYDLVTLACLHTLGNLYRLRNDAEGAAGCYDQAMPIYQKVLPEVHPARAAFHGHRAANYQALKRLPEALQEARHSQEIWRKLPDHRLAFAEACSAFGRLAEVQGHDEEALLACGEALQVLREELPVNDGRVLTAMGELGSLYVKTRRHAESVAFLEYVLSQYRAQPQLHQPERYLQALLDLISVRFAENRGGECSALLQEALQLLQTRLGPKEAPLRRILDGYKRLVQLHEGDPESHHGLAHLVLIFCGERERLRSTLEKFPHYVNARDATAWGPLHWAAFIGRDDIIHYLLQRGAQILAPGDQVSPLHVAAAWGKRECLVALLEAGGDADARDPRGWTPLFWCAYGGQAKLVELLLKRGANPNLADEQGRTPLHIAAERGHLAMVAALVGSQARLNARDADSLTPLHLAARQGHLAVCECLVYNGASLVATEGSGKSAPQCAAAAGHRLVHRVLSRLARAGLGKQGAVSLS